MLKGHLNKYELNGKEITNDEAIKYAKDHPETYQVYLNKYNEEVIRTVKGGFDLKKKNR